jgi:hypothetical protein
MATNPWDSDPIVAAGPRLSAASFPASRKPNPDAVTAQPDPGARKLAAPAALTIRLTNDTLDDQTTTFYAQQVLAGAPMPAMGMGKVASQNRQKVMKKVAEIAGGQGLSGR